MAVSIMWTHDLLMPLFLERRKEQNKIVVTSLFTLGFGILVTLFSVFIDKESLDLVEYTCILVSSLSVPFIFGVVGLWRPGEGR